MSHKYAHIRTVAQLEDEMLKLKLRKTIIRNELAISTQTLKDEFTSGQYWLSLLLRTFGGRKKSEPNRDKDTLDRVETYASWISNILELINTVRK